MNNATINPGGMHEPLGIYSHAVKVDPGASWLAISGQLGVDADGQTAEGFSAQAEQALKNVVACLEAGGMAKEDLVKLTIFSTVSGCMPDIRAARRKVMGEGVLPAVTLLVVAGLATPEFLVEIEGWAAKPANKL
jgi:enamine deaminase RidA (YjgF/YER057c/UK114 family)